MYLNAEAKELLSQLIEHYTPPTSFLDEGDEDEENVLDMDPTYLDFSRKSAEYIENTLREFGDIYELSMEILSSPDMRRFMRQVAYYLGETISRAVGSPIDWLAYEDAKRLPQYANDPNFQNNLTTEVTGIINGHPIQALYAVYDNLHQDGPQVPIKDFVEYQISLLTPDPAADDNERAAIFIAAANNDEPVHGGLIFREALRRQHLDGSLESLERLQILLDEARFYPPEYMHFPSFVNFLLLCAYYHYYVIARTGQVTLRWFSNEEARARLDKDLPVGLPTRTVCLLADKLYLPMLSICDHIFEPRKEINLRELAGLIIARLPAPLRRLARPDTARQQEIKSRSDKEKKLLGARHGGDLTASAISAFVATGAQCPPWLCEFGNEESRTIVDLSFMDNTVEHANAQLAANKKKQPYGIFICDGYANLPDGRLDAVIVDLRLRGGWFSREQRLMLNLPYRPGSHPEGFALFPPVVQYSSLDNQALSDICDAFFVGLLDHSFAAMDSFPAFTWDKFYRPSH